VLVDMLREATGTPRAFIRDGRTAAPQGRPLMALEGFVFATSFPRDPFDLAQVDVLVGGCGDPAVEQKSHIWELGAGSAILAHPSNDTPAVAQSHRLDG
jgi:hypothetical protein